MEAMLVVVGLMKGSGPDRFIIHSRVEADTGFEWADPPITTEEMQHVALAAKLALFKVLRARKRKK